MVETRQSLQGTKIDWNVASRSTTGLSISRLQNEDSYGIRQMQLSNSETLILGVVADGMGGMSQGEVASKLAVQTVLEEPIPAEFNTIEQKAAWLVSLVQKANESVATHVRDGGTTLSITLAVGRDLAIAHVGDSHIYLLRQGEMRQLSEDHSLVAMLVANGAKLLHRDIKPENILIDGQDRAILIDFGATKEFIAGQTRQMSVTLTRGYAPLEQYSYKAKRWPATDIYALCASIKATDLRSSVNIAIKELLPEKATRQGTSISWPYSITLQFKQQELSKWQREAHYLSRCVHPNIGKVYDWLEDNNTAYIVMEFISGKSLYQILQDDKPLLEERVKRYIIQIAEGLKVVHSNNLLHRDIKPETILIDDRDRAVLIDFGEAREFIPGRTSEMDVILTPGYAPLEQYSYKSKRYPATDIYALCASIYELLTGETPPPATDRMLSETLIPPR